MILHLDWDGLHFETRIWDWRFVMTINEEPMFGVEHPDGRFFGFWTEDFEFDFHRAPTQEELKDREIALAKFLEQNS